jgi:hypothetical protein
MNRLLILCLSLLAVWPIGASAEHYAVPAQFWLNARSGESLTQDPVLGQAVQRTLERPRAAMIIRHGRDDESLAHAEELRGWLIALGVDAGRVSLAANRTTAGAADRLVTIEVIDNK